MKCLVVNCNHWIGFHITGELLANDYQVDGIEGKNGNGHLSMFFGRNSSFTFVHSNVEKYYDIVVLVGKEQALQHVQAERVLRIEGNNRSMNQTTNGIEIQAPLLFGEWMPMNEQGFYHQHQWIALDSESLTTSGVYIKDFAKGLIQWLKAATLPEELIVKSTKQKDSEDVKQENAIYIRDHAPIQKSIKRVKDHYLKNKMLYDK